MTLASPRLGLVPPRGSARGPQLLPEPRQTRASPCSHPPFGPQDPDTHRPPLCCCHPWGPGQTPSHLRPLGAPGRLSPEELLALRPDDGPPRAPGSNPPAPTLRCAPSTVTEHRAPRLGGPWGHAREGAGPARVLSPQPQDGAGATGSRGKRPLRSCLGRTPGSRAEALRARSRDPSPLPPAGEGLPGGARLSARASLGSNPGHPLSEEKDPETAPRSPRTGCPPHT